MAQGTNYFPYRILVIILSYYHEVQPLVDFFLNMTTLEIEHHIFNGACQ